MSRRCPECGAEIPAGGPAGLCPQCLLGLALRSDASGDEARDATGSVSTPASAVLTLPPGAIAETPVVVTVGAAPEISGETESLLRGRLQVGSWIILVGLSAFMIRDLVSPVGDLVTVRDWLERFGVRILLIAFYAATIWLLRSPRRLDLRRLRALETAILWAVALWFASDRVYWLRYYIDQRNAVDAVFAVAFGFLTYFAFLSAYGFFSPNSWRRALWMTGLIALLPIGVLVLVALADPEGMAFLRGASDLYIEISSMVMMLGIGVMIATWGAHRIHTLRLEVNEAKRLGQYRLTERIGRGGMGEVWKAEHRLLARPAAIKLIKPEMIGARDPVVAHDFMRSFEREAQITANLRSTHTVELYDFGITDDAVFYYVMELLDGRDLESLVREVGALDPARVAFLLEQVCDSLAEAHDQGLVHRDIKPGNILACRLGRRFDFVKVLDFGLVKVRAAEVEAARPGSSRVTVIGTPAYIAPEMASGGAVDARTDIYSLGCVAYWMLTGRQVFEASNTAEILTKHVEEAATRPTERCTTEIPPALERIVMTCLEKDPARRPQSADELVAALRATGVAAAWTQEKARAWWEEHGK